MFTFFKRDCVMMMKQREFSAISAVDRIAASLYRSSRTRAQRSRGSAHGLTTTRGTWNAVEITETSRYNDADPTDSSASPGSIGTSGRMLADRGRRCARYGVVGR